MNLMLINVSTRKLRRAVRLPEGDLPVIAGDGTSKSAASRCHPFGQPLGGQRDEPHAPGAAANLGTRQRQ